MKILLSPIIFIFAIAGMFVFYGPFCFFLGLIEIIKYAYGNTTVSDKYSTTKKKEDVAIIFKLMFFVFTEPFFITGRWLK